MIRKYMITKIRTNGKMLMNISGEAPTPWAYAGVTNIEVLLNFEKQPPNRPGEIWRPREISPEYSQ
jgi:hypothetical protein